MKTSVFILLAMLMIGLTSCSRRVTVKPTPRTVKVVKVAPRGHKVVYVKGNRYYKWNGRHYRKTRNGYVYVRL